MSTAPNYRQIARSTALVLLTLGAAFLAWQFAGVLTLVGVSLAVSAMVRAPLQRLLRMGVRAGLAMGIVYGVGIAVAALLALIVVPPLTVEAPELMRRASDAYITVRSQMQAGGQVQTALAALLPDIQAVPTPAQGSATSAATLQLALGVTVNAADIASQSLLVIIISVYLTADWPRIERLALSLLAPATRARVRDVWREIESGLGAYLRSEVAQSVLSGALLTAAFTLLGAPFPFLTALTVSVAWLLPLVGGLLAVLAALALTAFGGPLVALGAALCTGAVLAVMEFVVERRLYPRERYGSVLVILINIVMVEAIGLPGLLVAPPLAAAIQIALSQWLRPMAHNTGDVAEPAARTASAVAASALVAPISAHELEALRLRLAALQQRLEQRDADALTPGAHSLRNLTERLNQLMLAVEQAT